MDTLVVAMLHILIDEIYSSDEGFDTTLRVVASGVSKSYTDNRWSHFRGSSKEL